MAEVKKYHLPPTALIPNSPHPVLHYPGLLHHIRIAPGAPEQLHDLFARNGWQTQWIFRYGATQQAHYHSRAHEAMAVLAGTATLRFGVADAEAGAGTAGVEVPARAGDVFVLPAGTAHKTFDAAPAAGLALLTPGDGHGIAAADVRATLAGVWVDEGFVMMGAYPVGSGAWDFAVGGEIDREKYGEVWAVPRPERDPVLGTAEEGLCGLWK